MGRGISPQLVALGAIEVKAVFGECLDTPEVAVITRFLVWIGHPYGGMTLQPRVQSRGATACRSDDEEVGSETRRCVILTCREIRFSHLRENAHSGRHVKGEGCEGLRYYFAMSRVFR